MEGSYNYWLVALSYVVAVVASYTALELARRVAHTSGKAARVWLTAGAVAMGIGIWTMHFTGMLALSLPMAFSYDVGTTLLSLLVGIAAAAYAIHTAARKQNSNVSILLSGLLLGLGIASMHYMGMAAMDMNGAIVYSIPIFILSVVIAVIAACAALWIMLNLADSHSRYLLAIKIGAAMVMGVAICGMHYTGMAAASYVPSGDGMSMLGNDDHTWLASTIAAMALIILGFTLAIIIFDSRLQSQHLRREKAEKESIQLSKVLDESSNEIYFIDSKTYRFKYVNRGALQNLGYTAEEAKHFTPLDIVAVRDVKRVKRALDPVLRSELNDLLLEARHRRKDGSEYPVQAHVQISNVADPPIIVAIVTDISQRKELETQLMQAQKMQSIGQLAAGIAHEINTPTQFVGDNTRFIQDSFRDLIGVSARFKDLCLAVRNGAVTPEMLDAIEASMQEADIEFITDEVPAAIDQSLDGISRISNIVRAMKEFSHPGGKELESIDLNSAIANTITVASHEWKYVAEVKTEFAGDLPPVKCYQQEINQVVLNLIVNAAHAIESAQGDECKEMGTITIATHATDADVVVSISDTGCGIPEEFVERIFEPFFTTKEVGKGTGQGLTMAYGTIVEKHKGALLVDSTLGEGTTFTIKLPRHDAGDDSIEEAA